MVTKGVRSREYVYSGVKISDVELWTRERQRAHRCRVGTCKNYRGLVDEKNEDFGGALVGVFSASISTRSNSSFSTS